LSKIATVHNDTLAITHVEVNVYQHVEVEMEVLKIGDKGLEKNASGKTCIHAFDLSFDF